MNFMASRREGFLEDGSSQDVIKSHPFSQSSSSSSSSSCSREKPFISFTYNHNHQTSSWFNNKSQDQEEPIIIDSSSHPNNNLITPLVNGDNEGHHHLHQFIITRNTIEGGGECSETAAMAATEKEHMFDKVVTPSDVGKLNRLVIPKQHAEKYFPLDSSNNEKGLLLNFEDSNGKPWRFRYSYWNSSQSYVMTKGWSRFVKEKKLDAGDIVSFQRGLGEIGKDRFFIYWRRRPHPPPLYRHNVPPPVPPFSLFRPYNSSLYFPPQTMEQNKVHFLQSHNHVHNNVYSPSSFIYLKSTALGGGGGGGGDEKQPPPEEVFESVPVVQGRVAAKRLRLFGVNMECPILDASTSNECEIIESTVIAQHQPFCHVNNKGKASMSLDLNI